MVADLIFAVVAIFIHVTHQWSQGVTMVNHSWVVRVLNIIQLLEYAKTLKLIYQMSSVWKVPYPRLNLRAMMCRIQWGFSQHSWPQRYCK